MDIPVPDGSTLEDLLILLVDKQGSNLSARLFKPGTREVHKYVRLIVNGRDIAFLNGLKTQLNDQDVVLILPPVSGG